MEKKRQKVEIQVSKIKLDQLNHVLFGNTSRLLKKLNDSVIQVEDVSKLVFS